MDQRKLVAFNNQNRLPCRWSHGGTSGYSGDRRPNHSAQSEGHEWFGVLITKLGSASMANMKPLQLIIACSLATLLGACASSRKAALELGRLADIPQSATDLKIDGTSNLFSSTYYLSFKANPAEIEEFIQNSPGLKGQTPTRFDPERQYLPYPKDGEEAWDDGNEHFFPSERYPWFDPTIRTRGRKYVIPQDKHANGGQVIVNDETHVVYIRASHS